MEINVRPTGWESAPAAERFALSHMGHLMPKIYVLIAEVFALPDTTDDAARAAIVDSMTAGLAYALAQFPLLAGTLEMDAVSGRMWVAKTRTSGISLHVQHRETETGPDAFPSFAALEAAHFPASALAAPLLLPPSVTAKQLHSPLGDNSAGVAVAVFQITFVRGGLVLGAAVHHCISDGPGCDGFLTTWAQNAAAAAHGRPWVPVTPFRLQGSPLDVANPSPAEAAAILAAGAADYPVVHDASGPMAPPPPGFQMPPLAPQMYHFPQSKLAALKAAASSSDGDWISTYDAIVALLWGGITRARADLLHPAPDTKAILVHALDTRRIFDPPLPGRFLGVGTGPARTVPQTVRDIVTPDHLPVLAAAVRASTRDMTPAYVTGLLRWVAAHADRRWLEVDIHSFLGSDLAASSWQGMTSYTAHDFGFGPPRALRWPSPAMDGFIFLFPPRAGLPGADVDEGVELVVCLEAGCQARLMTDAEVLKYGGPR